MMEHKLKQVKSERQVTFEIEENILFRMMKITEIITAKVGWFTL